MIISDDGAHNAEEAHIELAMQGTLDDGGITTVSRVSGKGDHSRRMQE